MLKEQSTKSAVLFAIQRNQNVLNVNEFVKGLRSSPVIKRHLKKHWRNNLWSEWWTDWNNDQLSDNNRICWFFDSFCLRTKKVIEQQTVKWLKVRLTQLTTKDPFKQNKNHDLIYINACINNNIKWSLKKKNSDIFLFLSRNLLWALFCKMNCFHNVSHFQEMIYRSN
jgi:hypothetical protein